MNTPFEENEIFKWEESPIKSKKYRVYIKHIPTDKEYKIDIGAKKYSQYRDDTPLKLYKDKDHNDKKRRELYYKRHKPDLVNKPMNANTLSALFLWSLDD